MSNQQHKPLGICVDPDLQRVVWPSTSWLRLAPGAKPQTPLSSTDLIGALITLDPALD